MSQTPKLFKYKKKIDDRGSFKKLLSEKYLLRILKNKKIKEINYSINKHKGTIRGLHYQTGNYKEHKIIYCLKGKIFDVSFNVDKFLKNKKKIYNFILDEKDSKFISIPENYAHGFQTLKNDTILLYLHTKKFNKKFERKINPLINKLNIKWPQKVSKISKSDKKSKNYA